MTSNDPLHGKTLEAILTELEAQYGWEFPVSLSSQTEMNILS
ncbi:MAG: VF530 family protein [Chitinophagaceae bacterium]|nr:VF530 family protein [Chitinophagaceae bacterium]